ncbi:unnamed protein product [Paramecium octaurelia]|uniref:Protein kinase domain-containing protein n=1 Tax=Paramecium octaurelia TaxID=43137 RepID=A0A8S1UHK4_PAROT|nr:unnamed protein product [Paramecium octaurelia]
MQQVEQFQVKFEKVIGRGAFGQIFQGEIDVSKVVALKVQDRITEHEKQILTALKGNQFDHIIEVIAFEENNKGVFTVMELGQCLQLQNQSDKRRICLEMSKGVAQLHKLRFFHRDLKPDNFVLGQDNKIKLIDFGISKTIESITQSRMQGTSKYMAPEVVACTDYDSSVDIWSLGILFYEVFTNEQFFAKFEESDMIQIIQEVQQIQINQKIRGQKQLEQWQKELLQKMIVQKLDENLQLVQSIERISIDEVIQVLEKHDESIIQDNIELKQDKQHNQVGLNFINQFILYHYTMLLQLMQTLKIKIPQYFLQISNFILLMISNIKLWLFNIQHSLLICIKEEQQKNDQLIQSNINEIQNYLKPYIELYLYLYPILKVAYQKCLHYLQVVYQAVMYFFKIVVKIPVVIILVNYNFGVMLLKRCYLIIQLFKRFQIIIIYQLINVSKPKQYPIALLIGEAGVGKTKLYNQINDSETLQYEIIETSSFDFQHNYEQREKQITEFQDIFYSKPNKVATLFLVVKFQELHLMKRSILNIYPYFKKFQSQITLVVTHFDLSDDQKQDKIDLQIALKLFKVKSILFVGQKTSKQELIAQIRASDCLIPIGEGYQFDLSDTIFEQFHKQNRQEVMNAQQELIE